MTQQQLSSLTKCSVSAVAFHSFSLSFSSLSWLFSFLNQGWAAGSVWIKLLRLTFLNLLLSSKTPLLGQGEISSHLCSSLLCRQAEGSVLIIVPVILSVTNTLLFSSNTYLWRYQQVVGTRYWLWSQNINCNDCLVLTSVHLTPVSVGPVHFLAIFPCCSVSLTSLI